MNRYLADLHIHTTLSPCGNSDMTPAAIVEKALKRNIDIIAVTDHNSTLQSLNVKKLGAEKGLVVLRGAEVSTREGVHCLAIFGYDEPVEEFQRFIDANLPRIKYDSIRYGHQLLFDESGRANRIDEYFLGTSLQVGLKEVEKTVHDLGGLFIPSHINRPHNSLLSEIRNLPRKLNVDALEIDCKYLDSSPLEDHPELNPFTLIRNSDAHHIEGIGAFPTVYFLQAPTFDEIRMALSQVDGRRIEIDFCK